MQNKYIFYCSIWCPLDDIRICIKNGQNKLKTILDYVKNYGDNEGITFLELTEDALKSLPVLMVDNMKCFNQHNIDTMAFNIKEIKCIEEHMEDIKDFFENILRELSEYGFRAETLIIKEIKVEEENTGKTVGKKDYKIYYNKEFAKEK